jgi:hypothetical protein
MARLWPSKHSVKRDIFLVAFSMQGRGGQTVRQIKERSF